VLPGRPRAARPEDSRRRANIDHIAVVPSGVCVIDSKHYKNRKIRVATPLIGSSRVPEAHAAPLPLHAERRLAAGR
jgi:hypothetical protein